MRLVNLKPQRRIAADILGVGKGKVWIDPEAVDDVSLSLTRSDISKLIADGVIRAHQNIGISSGRARLKKQKRQLGRQKGYGRRKGSAKTRKRKWNRWESHIRAQRRYLKGLRDTEAINPSQYRSLYIRAKGGAFRSVTHLRHTIEEAGMLKKPKRRRR